MIADRAVYRDSGSERALMEAIIEAAKWSGWLWYHVADSRRSVPGFPDLVLIKGHRLIVVECKAVGGTVSEAQWAWLRAFGGVDAEAYVIYPEHETWFIDEVLGG